MLRASSRVDDIGVRTLAFFHCTAALRPSHVLKGITQEPLLGMVDPSATVKPREPAGGASRCAPGNVAATSTTWTEEPYGFTDICPRCTCHKNGNHARARVHTHSEFCRPRSYEALRKDGASTNQLAPAERTAPRPAASSASKPPPAKTAAWSASKLPPPQYSKLACFC